MKMLLHPLVSMCVFMFSAFARTIWICMVTGGYKSPFVSLFSLLPYILLGRKSKPIVTFFTIVGMLTLVVMSHFSYHIPLSEGHADFLRFVVPLYVFIYASHGGAKLEELAEALKNYNLENKKKSIAAAHAKSEFVAVMSHEIRTPLQGVIGWVELLLEESILTENQETKKVLKRLNKCSTNLREVLSNILLFSRLSEKKLQLETPPLCIKELLRVLVSVACKGSRIPCYFQIDQNIPPIVRGPYFGIQQCLVQLISNALKFTREGSITVSCRSETIPGDENYDKLKLIFGVSDTGIGIEEAHQKILFEPFQQADYSIDRLYGGTGLGLAIVKNLALLMGGDTWFESREGSGSSFYFSCIVQIDHRHPKDVPDIFPRPECQPFTSPARRESSSSGQGQGQGPVVPLPILIADDNQMNHIYFRSALDKLGIPFLEAWNGKEVITILEKRKVSMILMDLHMPIMDGYEATNHIRKNMIHVGGSDIPIVAFTADSTDMRDELITKHKFTDVLEKPFTLDKLASCIKTNQTQKVNI